MKEKDKEKKIQTDSNIQVAIRIRPLNQKEIAIGESDIIRAQDNLMIILDPVEAQYEMENKKVLDVLHRSKEQRYAFDKIYRNQSSERIYEQTVKNLVKTIVTGKNATVFAYGPTGTGKTYTMLGNQDVFGLNVLAIRDLFNLIEVDHEFDYTILITYVQIYNEMIRDLLVANSGYLELRDDSDKGIQISGITEFKAESTEQVMNLLLIGNKRRTTEATNANQTSSRSHAVFQINVHKNPRTKNINVETLSGKLSLIDLAGSERGTVTENRGIRLMEGAKINRSLLALANCINALGDKNKKGFFVPYRDSKLTRLLKDSLGGNCKTVMIANVSPACSQFQETINTLKYANRAKNIKTKALTNKKLVSIHISEYKNIINDLRQEIEQLKIKLEKSAPADSIQDPLNPISNSSTSRDVVENQVCNCGKIEESAEIKKVKEQIFENFNERIQLRRALMEIQEQNALNILEIRKKQSEILFLKKSEPNQETPEGCQALEEIKKLKQTIQTLKLSTQKNILKKEITNLQLMESMTATKKIRQQIPKKVKSKQNREFLQIIIKNHVLELQNIELEINLQIQQKIINDLKNISNSQRKLIEEKGLDYKYEEQPIDNDDDIELEIEDDDENQNEGPLEAEGIDEEEEYKDQFEEIENQLMIQERFIKKRPQKNDGQDEENERKRKGKPLDANSPNIQLGVVGINNIKKRQKTVNDSKSSKNVEGKAIIQAKEPFSDNNMFDFNLKGTNVRLNEKLPFVMAPKDKKKK